MLLLSSVNLSVNLSDALDNALVNLVHSETECASKISLHILHLNNHTHRRRLLKESKF